MKEQSKQVVPIKTRVWLLIILAVAVLPVLVWEVTVSCILSFAYAHPFHGCSAAEILAMDHYDMGYPEYELDYGGEIYRDIPEEAFPYPLTEEHYSEYEIVEVISIDGAAGYALLCHREDVRREYLLRIPDKGPEAYAFFGTVKRPLGSYLKRE